MGFINYSPNNSLNRSNSLYSIKYIIAVYPLCYNSLLHRF